MPQWDFLNFLAEHGRRYPGFHLRMQAEATGSDRGGRPRRRRARQVAARATLDDPRRLVVGCDGRHSIVREKARP